VKVLDLYCGSGGAGMGYHRAGFDVTGVDNEPQHEYPFPFVLGDAIEYVTAHGHEYDLIHASPPCQARTRLSNISLHAYQDLIPATRAAVERTGKPYVIESVTRWGLVIPIMLCGQTFGLRMYRHRWFETTFTYTDPPHTKHVARCARNSYMPTAERPYMTITGRNGHISQRWVNKAAEYMGTPWITTLNGICEAIPPAYAEYIGRQFLTSSLVSAA
jgi:DNA (cytosine-5)-methyltransferase 1